MADIFLSPSFTTKAGDREGLPNTFLEAMAMNVPVVATNIDGIDRIFTHKVDILISKQRNVLGLTKNIHSILNDQKLRNKIVNNAYNEVLDKYSWDKVAEQYLNLFRVAIIK